MSKAQVYREADPTVTPYFGDRPYWVAEVPLPAGYAPNGASYLSSRRSTWRAAMDAVATHRELMLSGWRPW